MAVAAEVPAPNGSYTGAAPHNRNRQLAGPGSRSTETLADSLALLRTRKPRSRTGGVKREGLEKIWRVFHLCGDFRSERAGNPQRRPQRSRRRTLTTPPTPTPARSLQIRGTFPTASGAASAPRAIETHERKAPRLLKSSRGAVTRRSRARQADTCRSPYVSALRRTPSPISSTTRKHPTMTAKPL